MRSSDRKRLAQPKQDISYIIPYDAPGFIDITTAQAKNLQDRGMLKQLGTLLKDGKTTTIFTRPVDSASRKSFKEIVRCYLVD